MLVRIISGVIGAGVLIAVLLCNTAVISTAVAVASIIAVFEIYRSVKICKSISVYTFGILTAAVLPFCGASRGSILLVVALYTFFMLLTMLFQHKTVTLEDCAKAYFLTLYISLFMSSIAYVRAMSQGEFLVWFIVIGAFACDTFAYFTGVLLGKHKLCPEISPKKTIEGAVGGVIGTMLCYAVYGYILENSFSMAVSYPVILVLGAVAAVISQLGDLTASVIKREYKVKDYGRIIPGHGGIMDRCDSLMFVAPAIYLFLIFTNGIFN